MFLVILGYYEVLNTNAGTFFSMQYMNAILLLVVAILLIFNQYYKK